MTGRPTGQSVRPVGRSVHTLRQSDRQSDEIKHPTVCRMKRLHDTIVGPTSRTDQSDRPVGLTIGTCKRPLSWLAADNTDIAAARQNAAARLIFELRGCEHVTPSLIQLHWLPVRCAQSCTQCTLSGVPAGNSTHSQQHVLDYARQCQPTTSFHDCAQSSANAPSPTPVQLHEIHFQYTSEKRWTFIVLNNFLRHTLIA